MAGVLKTKPLNRVLDDESPVRSVYFKAVNVMVSIGGIIGAGHAPDRSTGESQCQGHRAIAASGLVCHFRHHGVDRAAQMFQLIEAVTLCLDEICMGMRADVVFPSKPPDRVSEIPQPTFCDGFASQPEGLCIAVIEVDGK